MKNYGRFYLELRGWRWLGLNLEKNLEILEIWEFFSQYLQYLAKEGLVAPITFFLNIKPIFCILTSLREWENGQ